MERATQLLFSSKENLPRRYYFSTDKANRIACGTYGEVYKATRIQDGKTFAIKLVEIRIAQP
jgi:hypothetical protein